MGNIGRGCYLALPFLCTLASLICLIIVLLGLSNKSNDFLSSLYFLRLDTSKLSITANVAGQAVTVGSSQAQAVAGLEAKYDIGLFNYCSGPNINANPTLCGGRTLGYYFDPPALLKVNTGPLANLVPKEWEDALNTYHSVSKVASAFYVISLIGTILALILGLLSFWLSRISTFMTTIVTGLSALFLGLASGTATGMFIVIKGVVYEKIHKYGVNTDIGGQVLAVTWIAFGFAFVATLLWSCGCCCGHERDHSSKRRQASLRGRNAYERVPSPYKNNHHEQHVPLQNQQWPGYAQHTHYQGAGYEPFRADGRV